MAKLRIEVVPDFGPQKGQVLSGIVVEPNYDAVLKAVQNKLKLKKKESELVTLCCLDFTGMQVLPKGDLSGILHNGAKVVVCHGQPGQTVLAGQLSKAQRAAQKAADQLQLVPVADKGGCLSARGRPNLETLSVLQKSKGITGIVTLLRHDEASGAAKSIGQACERLGLRWCHAPLAGPKEMRMIGDHKPALTQGDLDSFRKVCEVRKWLESGDAKLVVHCAAGLHRTGLFLYVLLRELGHDPESAEQKIQQMRRETFEEFTRLRFRSKAEELFSSVGSTASSATPDIEIVAERVSGKEPEEEEDGEVEEEQCFIDGKEERVGADSKDDVA